MEILLGPLEVKDHFDTTKGTPIRMIYADLFNEILHCDGLIWYYDDNGLPDGFLVFSDRNTLKRLISVPLSEYRTVLREFTNDRPLCRRLVRDTATGKITVEVS
jgi:hypothetical protein